MLNNKRLAAFRMINFTKDNPIMEKLPAAYKKFYKELYEIEPKPVHHIPEKGRWKKDEVTGVITPVQNVPIPTMFPSQLNKVLLGGEMVVRGFQKRKPMARRVPFFWVPELHKSVVYSEVLNKYFSVIVTQRFILHLHEAKGFDAYLLQNLACDLKTKVALRIKKKILQSLLDKDLPYDEKKNNEIYEKYKQYIIPRDELEWYGLTLTEATLKLSKLEDEERSIIVPLKWQLRQELLEELKESGVQPGQDAGQKEEVKKGWLSKITKPFSSRT